MAIEIVFLGTGTSAGVPMIGCDCDVCRSNDPRDRRDRPSILVRYGEGTGEAAGPGAEEGAEPTTRQVLVDAGPELRQQAVRQALHRLDGIMFTHAHADHIFGLDDVRRFNAVMGQAVDIYGEPAVLDRLREMFKYIFEPHQNTNRSFVANLIAHPIEPETPVDLHGARWTPLRLLHGKLEILGFRVDMGRTSIAYCTDVSRIPPRTYPLLRDLDVLVIDALRYRHHPTHMTVDQALEQIEALQPGQAYFTHIAHDIKHADLEPTLPDGVHLAHDDLVVRAGFDSGS